MDLTMCKATPDLAARAALLGGIVAPILFVAGVIGATYEYAGYNHLTQAISELAATDAPAPGTQTINFLITGLLLMLFGHGVWRSSGDLGGGLLITLFGAAMLAQGAAPCDAGCNFVTTTGAVHNVTGLAGFVAAIGALWIHARRSAEAGYRRYSRVSAIVAFAGFIAWIALGKVLAIPSANGVLQRLFVGTLLLWFAVTAWAELTRQRRRSTTDRLEVNPVAAVAPRLLLSVAMLCGLPAAASAQDGAAESFTPGSPATVASFLLIVAGVIVAFTGATYFAAKRDAGPATAHRATRTFIVGALVWLGAFTAFVGSGLPQTRPIPFVPLTLLGVNAVAFTFALSAAGARLARHTPLVALVAFQGFRLPLELVLHEWSEQGTIPTAMTWTGSNWDIVTGVSALALAPFSRRPAVAWVANLIGIVLLVNVGRVAILTSPAPFGWDIEPKLMLVAHLPYAYVAAVCVAGAVAGHIILTRRLLGGS